MWEKMGLDLFQSNLNLAGKSERKESEIYARQTNTKSGGN